MATIAQLLGVAEKLSFFESAILNFFFSKKKKIFWLIVIQISHNLWGKKLGVCNNMRYTVLLDSFNLRQILEFLPHILSKVKFSVQYQYLRLTIISDAA